MWNKIVNNDDVMNFMNKISYFHDSCIKEMNYLSGAYVNENLSMHPINDRRLLKVIIQRQFEDLSVIELEFVGLKYLKLFPTNEQYTCDILDSTIILKNDCVYWCDCGDISETELDYYEGTLVCAEKLRWRVVDVSLGQKDFFVSVVE